MPSKIKKVNDTLPLGPGTFAMETSKGRWKAFPHLVLVIELLMYLVDGKYTRLMVFMPPRHGKSLLISKYFLTWFIGSFPDLRIILATHSATFSAKWGRISKQLLEQYGVSLFSKGVTLDKESNASYRWDIEGYEGGLVTSGIGGAILGEGAHGMIIDDPTKGFKKSNSPTHQQELNDWWYTEARTRLDKDQTTGRHPWVIYIAQRLGKKDLAGQILNGLNDDDPGEPHFDAIEALDLFRSGKTIDPGTWVVFNLPALAEENDILRRKPGEPLCPEIMGKKDLKLAKHNMGSFRFESIYQGNPQETEGTLFKSEWFFDENGNILSHLLTRRSLLLARLNEIRYWDFASSGKKGDATAGIRSTWNSRDQILTFRGLVHGKYSAAGVVDAYIQTTLSDGKNVRSIIEQEREVLLNYCFHSSAVILCWRVLVFVQTKLENLKWIVHSISQH
jgi:hypothetical protein